MPISILVQAWFDRTVCEHSIFDIFVLFSLCSNVKLLAFLYKSLIVVSRLFSFFQQQDDKQILRRFGQGIAMNAYGKKSNWQDACMLFLEH